jgi:hypothetical protein
MPVLDVTPAPEAAPARHVVDDPEADVPTSVLPARG